jgi:hypothetical protein
METAPLKKVGGRPPRLLKAIVRALLPYILREEVMANFDEDYNSLALPQFLRHISRTVWIMISMQVRQTINFEQAGAHACALYLAFAAAAISPRTLILVAVVLSVLISRSANRHPAEGSPQETALDTIIAVTFGFASQPLIGLFAPSLTLSSEIMMRGAVMSPFLVCTLSMMFRRPGLPPEGSWERSLRALRATWALNILWFLAFSALVLTNTEALPASVPRNNVLFGFAPVVALFLVYRLQQNVLPGTKRGVFHRHRDELLIKRDMLWGADRTHSGTDTALPVEIRPGKQTRCARRF